MIALTRKAPAVPITAPQARFLRSLADIVAMVSGRGAGKTWIGSYRIITRARRSDEWMAVSPDAGVSLETTVPTFIETAQRLDRYIRHVMSPYPKVWWVTSDGGEAEIVFRSGEKPDKLRGPNKSGLWLDEASYQHEDVYRIARATLRKGGVMGPTLMTMTPRGRSHWTFEVLYEPTSEDDPDAVIIMGQPYRPRRNTECIPASTRDNPFLPAEFYASMAENLSPLMAEQELEGHFVEIAGLMFQRQWLPIIDNSPREAMRIRYWDKAASVLKDSPYTAGVRIARDPKGIFYIEDVVRGQWSFHDRDVVIKQTASADHHLYSGEVFIYAEQEPGSGGKESMLQMIKMLAGYPVYRDLPSARGERKVGGVTLPGGPKITRAQPFAAQAEAGNVRLVRGHWNQEFISECVLFPESSVCDQVDAASAGLNRLAILTQPDNVVAGKAKVSVDSERFGQSLKRPGPKRRRLYRKE